MVPGVCDPGGMNVNTDVALIVALVALFAVATVLGAAEAALIRVPRARAAVAAAAGDRTAARVLKVVDNLPLALNTILLVVLLAQIGAATVVGVLAGRHFGGLGVTLLSIALTLFLFVYAEAIPKTIAVRDPLRVARLVVPLVTLLVRLLRPITRVLVAFANLQAPGSEGAGRLGVSEDELRYLAREAVEAGEIDPSDHELIERGFRFGDTVVGDIFVPRLDVVAVQRDTPVREALDVIVAAGHRRLPVHEGDLDSVVGVVHLRDLVAAVSDGAAVSVGELLGPVLIVPETNPVVDVLDEMQSTGRHIAMVIDEHGGTSGLVTIEDVVEELVGRVADEGARRPVRLRKLSPGRWEADGRCETRDLAQLVEIELPEGPYRTIGGLLMHLADRVPEEGEEFNVAGHTIRIDEGGAQTCPEGHTRTRRRPRQLITRSPAMGSDLRLATGRTQGAVTGRDGFCGSRPEDLPGTRVRHARSIDRDGTTTG